MADEEKKLEDTGSFDVSPNEKTQIFSGDRSSGVRSPYLVIVDGPHKGARYPLQAGINILGRLEECHVVLDDQSVSRKHAELNLLEKGWTIKDLQSKNGTYVNGAPVEEEVVIGHKDLLRLGLYSLRFVAEEISLEEEMDIPSQDVGEWGTVVIPEGPSQPESETARISVGERSAIGPTGHDVTDEHSPLEEEAMPADGERPKSRIWFLSSILFVLVLGASLYFYWDYVLAPEKNVPSKPVAMEPGVPPTIPLGPPSPEKPKKIPVFLDCVANPFPAKIIFQGKEIGRTPLKINVELEPERIHDIEAHFEMAELNETYTGRISFQIISDQSTVPLLFRAPVGTIKVTALPRDASLYLEAYFDDNKFQGRPVKLTQIVLNKPIFAPYGRYIVELRQSQANAQPSSIAEEIVYRREFILAAENPAFVLEVTEGMLQQMPAEIRSVPPGADVFIDQQKIGQTPFSGTLNVGKHILTVRKEGYFEATQNIESQVNMPFRTEIILQTSLAGNKLNEAKTFLRQQMFMEAVQVLSEVFNLNPASREIAEGRYLLGNAYLALQDFSKAQGYYEQAKGHDDFKFLAKLGMALTLYEQGQISQALIPLVEVMLNAKEEILLKEAHVTFGKISPLRSVIYIQSDPVGATVYLNNNKLAQITPILLHEVGLGSYKIRLEKPGYQPFDLNVNLTVNEFNPILTTLKPTPQ